VNQAALKSDLHKLIDSLDNEEILLALFDFIDLQKNDLHSNFWHSLTSEQKNQISLSFEESNHDESLISWDTILNKFK
jgi:hypothetical protein